MNELRSSLEVLSQELDLAVQLLEKDLLRSTKRPSAIGLIGGGTMFLVSAVCLFALLARYLFAPAAFDLIVVSGLTVIVFLLVAGIVYERLIFSGKEERVKRLIMATRIELCDQILGRAMNFLDKNRTDDELRFIVMLKSHTLSDLVAEAKAKLPPA